MLRPSLRSTSAGFSISGSDPVAYLGEMDKKKLNDIFAVSVLPCLVSLYPLGEIGIGGEEKNTVD
jgi:hypothetical protein